MIDNGWASAAHWAARREAIEAAIDRAARDGRTIVLAPTAPGQPVSDLLSPDQARNGSAALRPSLTPPTVPRSRPRWRRNSAAKPTTACCGCPMGSIMARLSPSLLRWSNLPALTAVLPCFDPTRTTQLWPSDKGWVKAANSSPASSPSPRARVRRGQSADRPRRAPR